MKKIILFILISFLFIKVNAITLAPNSKSAILIEASTGEVLFEKDADLKNAPASMTKMMSMLLIMEAIDKNVISWNQMITVSENASKMGGSQILLETGEQMSVEDLFKGVAIASGNDAVVALSEAIAGSVDNFVSMMNKKADELGLKNTNFKNPHGLDEVDHYSSARDMAIIARELVKHEKVLEYTSIYETYLRENLDTKIWLVNTNKLVRFKKGVDGLKTGFTDNAGYCLTATMKQNNMRLISVVMNYDNANVRNNETSEMLDYGFAQYTLDVFLTQKSILGKKEVLNGNSRYVNIVPKGDVTFLTKKMEEKINPTYKVKVSNISAPIKKGDIIGKLYIMNNNEVIKEVDLTVEKDVRRANIIKIYFRNILDILSGNIK